jgi:hypothetical protein
MTERDDMLKTNGDLELIKDHDVAEHPDDATAAALARAAPDMLAALKAVAPLLAAASKAYQFGASSYTYAAMVDCMKAHDIALAAITKATVVEEPDIKTQTLDQENET